MAAPLLFCEWIKQRRKLLDLTQEELAVRAGCSVFALRKIESGERRPSKQLASLLAQALEIPAEENMAFVHAARGELTSGHLPDPTPEPSYKSFSDFLIQHEQIYKTRPTHSTIEMDSGNLPLYPTPLLGRESELAALERIFKDPKCRLLTLTGMGGIGKTKLAVEFASRQKNTFLDGVHYVPLASINSEEMIVPAIAEALGCTFSGPSELREQLFSYASSKIRRPGLLVLDNLEHLIAKSTDLVDLISEFLQKIPELKILTTSRERLNLQGEWMYELHGLPVPPVEFTDKLGDYSSAALFIQRACQIKDDFELSELDKTEVVRICHLVDGVPLAIELAAAWVGMLSCNEIAHEIESNIDFLSTTMHDLPERHRSLRAAFDHSWKLLSDHERDVLSRLSVFRGGFDRKAAEAVAGATLPLLASLVFKSLIRHPNQGRYDLHEVIRQYAATHLDDDAARCHATCEKHCEYFLILTAEYERKLKSASQQQAVQDMTNELDNLRIAWDWGVRHEKFESLGKAVRAFGWFYEVSGLLHDGIDQLDQLVRSVENKTRTIQLNRVLGITLTHQGLLYFRIGQFAKAQELYEQSIDLLRSVDEQTILADALIFSGTLKHLSGEYLEARTRISEGLNYAKAANDSWFAAYGIYNLGHVDFLLGENQKGYDQMQEGMRLWREIGDPHSISLGLNFLVNTQIQLGKFEEARTSMLESISLCEHTKNRWGLGTAYRYLGLICMASGQITDAKKYLHKSLEVFGGYFKGWDIAISLIYLGDANMLLGEHQDAENNLKDGLRLAKEIFSRPLMLDALSSLAKLNVLQNNHSQAWELSYLVLSQPQIAKETTDRTHQTLRVAERMLDEQQIRKLKQKISSLTINQVASEILQNLTNSSTVEP